MPRKNPVKCICPVCGKEYYTLRPRKPVQACSIKCACEKRRQNYILKYGKPNHIKGNNREKAKQTCLKKYNVENPSQIIEVKKKKEETCLKHYGVKYFSQCDESKEKFKQRCLEKYGVENLSQSEEIKEKIKQTNLNKYGYESHNSNDVVKEHKKEACLNKYGYESVFQVPEIREKIKKISLEKYGVENPGGSKEAIEKIKETKIKRYGTVGYNNREKAKRTLIENNTYVTSELENLVYKLLSKKFKVIRQYFSEEYPWPCDFYIEELQLYIEIQGYPSHGKVGTRVLGPYDPKNLEHQKLLKEWQEKAKNNSWYTSAIRVWTKEDPLKRQTAKENKLNWIEFFTLEQFLYWYLEL